MKARSAVIGDCEADGSYFIYYAAAKYLIAPDGFLIRSFTHKNGPETIAAYFTRILGHISI